MQKDSTSKSTQNKQKSSPRNNSTFSGAHDYFSNNVLPQDIHARTRHIKAPTSYINNQEQTFFLLVRSGTGTIYVNGMGYKLKPNTLIYLSPFHRYRLLPSARRNLPLQRRASTAVPTYI